jgi:DNA-binding response OmpR family regulator
MAGGRPTILVVDDDWDERAAIAALLRQAGFAVVAAPHDLGARAAMTEERFAAAVIALPEQNRVAFRRHARRRQPGLRALIVVEPAAVRFVDADGDTVVARPFDARQLLGGMFELVLRDGEDTRPQHSHAAEFGIAAAKLACLDSRRSAAAAAGARGLARDLTRQIGETMASRRSLAAAIATARPPIIPRPAD